MHATGSNHFYQSVPIHPAQNNNNPFYDVGATFYEDIVKAGLRILDAPSLGAYFVHYEGSSWHRQSGNPGFEAYGERVYKLFLEDCLKYSHVNIFKKFMSHVTIEDLK